MVPALVQEPPLPPALYVQPSPVQAVCVVLDAHVALVCWEHVPLPEAVQPGRLAQFGDEHVDVGTPVQCGPVVKIVVGAGKRVSADLQQIWFLQSLD